MSMLKRKLGFTIIEVALFLAVTGALFAGIAIGTQNSISQQRFTDAVQNYAEFLRSVYSEVSNPQSIGEGRSETMAIYGKLIVFGESVGLDYNTVKEGEQRIYVYDVVGDVVGTAGTTGSVQELMNTLKANVVALEKSGEVYRASPAGIVEDYLPRWGSQIEVTDKSGTGAAWTGSILVVRHPRSGTINTLVYEGSEGVIEVNDAIEKFNRASLGNTETIKNLLIDKMSGFKAVTVDFCVNPSGYEQASEFRRDIRLVKNSRNASGVEIIDMDSDANACRN